MTLFLVGVCLIVVAFCVARAYLTGSDDRCRHCGKERQ